MREYQLLQHFDFHPVAPVSSAPSLGGKLLLLGRAVHVSFAEISSALYSKMEEDGALAMFVTSVRTGAKVCRLERLTPSPKVIFGSLFS